MLKFNFFMGFIFLFVLLSCNNSTKKTDTNEQDSLLSDTSTQHQEKEEEITDEDIFFFEEQKVELNPIQRKGYILDIGGGGEGIIGLLEGERVIAIDISRQELEDAPEGPLKIIMDATDLKFLDNTFHTVTSFFTLMYLPPGLHKNAFSEFHRVLQPGGKLIVWDFAFPAANDTTKKVAAFHLNVKLPDNEINTGYGTKWPKTNLNQAYYLQLAQKTGFEVVSKEKNGQWFYIELQKAGSE